MLAFKHRIFIKLIVVCLFAFCKEGYTAPRKVWLAKNNQAKVTIVLPQEPSVTLQFAGEELAKYLEKISHASFIITSSQKVKGPAIYIRLYKGAKKEEYAISCNDKDIVLSGNEDRTALYAVYDFLEHLGCQWLAPEFSFYNGTAEYVPNRPELLYEGPGTIIESPVFTYRKLDVEEGLSHTTENLKQLIDWMPKLRFNTLMVPSDYQGSGRVQWDKWRKELTPELKKRGLIIEVGGHGYQNFINPSMEDGQLFLKHPGWFGKNKECQPDKDEKLVFNTANEEAVQYFIDNILKYIREHPEIDIFDLWPPDSGKWAECPSLLTLGSPEDRQARLLNQVDSAIKLHHPNLRLQIIAYAKTIQPPKSVTINNDILVDFCPIDQNFESQIYDTLSVANVNYVDALYAWRTKFSGDIGLYSYFRKYAWKSLPNVIPHYIQKDMQWYAKVPLQGILTYAEPGDWYTYELNHYILGKLGWNPQVRVDSFIRMFCTTRYGREWEIAENAYKLLGHTVRIYGNTRHSSLKPTADIAKAIAAIEGQIAIIRKVKDSSLSSSNFDRLLLMLQYAAMDMDIRKAFSVQTPQQLIHSKIEELLLFFKNNSDRGTIVVTGRERIERFIAHYYRKN